MSVKVTIQAINVSWKRDYSFERLTCVSFENLKSIVHADNPMFAKEKQIFVYMGCIVTSNETLLFDPSVDAEVQHIELILFVANFNACLSKQISWKLDEESVTSAKTYLLKCNSEARMISSNIQAVKALLDTVSDPKAFNNVPAVQATGVSAQVEETHDVAPVVQPAQVPVVPVVPGPVLPVVEWFQWAVMARLILVAFLFTYNRNLNTEKLAHMAAMTLFSYLFQIGAFGYLFAWLCYKMGINFNPPVEPAIPAIPAVPNMARENAPGEGGEQNAPAEVPHLNAEAPAPGGGVPAPPQPRVAAAVPPRAPLNAVQYFNQLCRDGLMIPTTPGLFLDVLSFFMGLFFSIVPSWTPYRLHR